MAKWGDLWGPALWGGLTTSVDAQGSNPRVKDDTVFAGGRDDSTVSSAVWSVDESQHGRDLTDGTGYAYFNGNDPTFEVTAPWAIEVRVQHADADTGYIIRSYISGQPEVYRLRAIASNVISVDGGSITLPGSFPADFIIALSADLNPLTTGASDAVLYTLSAWNLDDGSHAQDQFLGEDLSWVAGNNVFIVGASNTSGSSAYSGEIHRVRLSQGRYHTPTETREDFVGRTTTQSYDGVRRRQPIVPDVDSNIGDQGEFAGPVWAMAAKAVQDSDMRLVSPLVNKHFEEIPWLDSSNQSKYEAAALDGTHTVLGNYLWYCPCPNTINRLKARIHVQAHNAVGDPSDISLRLRSMKRPPLSSASLLQQSGPVDEFYATQIVNAADKTDVGDGQWYEFDLIPISRDPFGGTYVALSFDSDDADQQWRINAVTVDGVYVPSDGGGGLGFGVENG